MMNRILLISIKPEYANRIFKGVKTIELRKTSPKVNKDDLIVFYVTSPEKMVKGIGKVKEIVEDTPSNLWLNYRNLAGINEDSYFDYFENSNKAVGILLKDIVEFDESISLSKIKSEYPSFAPPQSYQYLNKIDFLRKFSFFGAHA